MFRFIPLLLALFIFSCSDGAADAETTPEVLPPDATATPASTPVAASPQNGTLLCQVNGKAWHYTKASGIINTDRKTGARTALITFKRKLDKGSENIQLYYDAATNEIQRVSMQLKCLKDGGGRFTGYYDFSNEGHIKKLPGSSMEGSIDLSDPKTASGSAEFMKVSIRYEADQLANPEDAVVSVTGLRFSGVGYSDLAREKARLGL